MLFNVDSRDGEKIAFDAGEAPHGPHTILVGIDDGSAGATATIPDAHLLFTAHFARTGADLILRGEDGKTFAVLDYFATDQCPRLLSPNGAALSGDIVTVLAGPLTPGHYAQAGATPAKGQAVGRVVQVEGDATIVRNGVTVAAHSGDAILKGDVLQTVGGALSVTFNDGSTLNLTANARLVVNEFVYDPNGSANSQLVNLIQGSLTFISGEVAHHGDMKIGTPVATMGIRGTVGGIATADDGTVHFYVSQSTTGAVVTDSQGDVIAHVVQNGPLIVVHPVAPLQVLAEEVQKSPAELAIELSALQHIVSIQSVGQQIIQQLLQPIPDSPNPQSIDLPHSQIQIDLHANPIGSTDTGNNGGLPTPESATITFKTTTPDSLVTTITSENISVPPNLPPVIFGPLHETISEDASLTFSSQTGNAISVFDVDTAVLQATLAASHGVLSLSGTAGLTFVDGDGHDDATMTFSGTQTDINNALEGMVFNPAADYNGAASITVSTSDGHATTISDTINITINPVNDAPVITQDSSQTLAYSENQTATAIDTGLVLYDVDSTTLAGATVIISGNFHDDEDVLSFVNQNGITGHYVNGVLTLTGTASVADYQAALHSVEYANTSDDPSGATRIVSYQVDDGSESNHLSNIVTATITVTSVNDAPVISGAVSTGGVLGINVSDVATAYLTDTHDLINGLGGPAGFGENSLPANDDGSTGAIDITSVFGDAGLNFFGTAYQALYINNNGNITFDNSNSAFTPDSLTASNYPIIAPFWADVDTRGGAAVASPGGNSTGSNLVYYDLDTINHVMTITWDDVGYYSQHTNAVNAFQLQLIGLGDGNFDIIFRYEDIQWTVGDVSGNAYARAGYSAGDGNPAHSFELAQSGNQSAMLALDVTAGVSGIPGVEVVPVESNNVSATTVLAGTISFTDPDVSDTHTASVQSVGAGSFGTFTLDDPENNSSYVTETNGSGSVAWHFNLTSGETDSILLSGAATQSYEVTIADGHNATATQMVSVAFAGNGNDNFVFNFNAHLGAETILNFNPNLDHIELDGYNTISNNDQLIAAISSNGLDAQHGDAVISLGNGDSITIAGVTQSYLQQHLDSVVHLNGVQVA